MALTVFILSAFLVFKTYILRGLAGQWKSAGDAYGQGKQFDPIGTFDCFSFDGGTSWVDRGCYKAACGGCLLSAIKPEPQASTQCRACMQGCARGCPY
jgi:hypothetical protein